MPDASSPAPFRSILVAIDGSDNSRRAATVAVDVAKKYGASLFVLHVIPRPVYTEMEAPGMVSSQALVKQYIDMAKKNAKVWVAEAVSMAEAQNVKVRGEIIENIPSVVQTITEYADEWKVDLIVVGTRGLSGFRKLLLGSVSSGIVSHSSGSVLVVR